MTISAAAGWEKWDRHYQQSFRPVFDHVLAGAAVRPGARVLDLACGTGQPAIPAARIVGPAGEVVAIDVSAEFLDAARRLADAAGVRIAFHEMDAARLSFPDASFDAATCAFATMFFPDPVGVLAGIRRVLVPGGRLAVAVWDAPEKNPFLTTLFGPLMAMTKASPPPPGAPGPFRFAAPGALEAVFTEAGFSDVRSESVPFSDVHPDVEHWFAMNADMATPLKNALRSLPPADAARLKEEILRAVVPHVHDGRVHMLGTALCVSARA